MSMLLPGSTIAVLGGGQLGRMLAFEARRMGYSVGVLDPDGKGPAAQVAELTSRQPLMTRVRHWSWQPGPMSSPWKRNSSRITSWSSSKP